jgi:hypothetical protein
MCRSTGHLRRECKGLFEEAAVSKDLDSPNDFIDLSTDTRFYSGGPKHWSQGLEDPEPTSTFSGKLKYHSSYFFSTLLTLEKETLSSLKWLEPSTLHICPQTVKGVGGLPVSNQLIDSLFFLPVT